MLQLKCFCEELMSLEANADHWYATSCGHMFHYLCLTNWLERSSTCPQCRKPVRQEQMFRLYPAASDEAPKDDINDLLKTCLNATESQLEQMTALCKKKDADIASLKIGADNNKKRENEALKTILHTFDGESLDKLFDDPNRFDEMLRGKIELIKEDEQVEQSTSGNQAEGLVTNGAAVTPRTTAPAVAVVQPRTIASAGPVSSTADPEMRALESSLNMLQNMLTRVSSASQ